MGKDGKGVDVMSTSTMLRKEEYLFAKEMESYIKTLRNQQKVSQDDAYADAKEALKRTGVINRNGNTKKKIVSWE